MTKVIQIGNVKIGGGNPVAIQSMTNTKTSDVAATIDMIRQLEALGCKIVRVAVKNADDAAAIRDIKRGISLPLVADIHFDYRLAVKAIQAGADKIRMNPGNIGSDEKVQLVVDAAKASGVPIRVGVNSGSLDEDIERKYGHTAEALAESALKHVAILEKFGFEDIVISCKASSVTMTVESNRILHRKTGYPLHLGVTEAGTFQRALVKSAMGIGSLLMDGIGDTVRVSVTGSPLVEIDAAKCILRAAGLPVGGVDIISCPTCGRCGIDLESIVEEVERRTAHIKQPLKVAVMGCIVNGVGEGKFADVGLAGGERSAVIFSGGKVLKKVGSDGDMVGELLLAIEKKLGDKI